MRHSLIATALVLLIARPASADLISLGNGMIYDTVQDLTWLQDTLLTRTQGLDPRGRLTAPDAVRWVSDLTYGGYDDWRLPRAHSPGADDYSGLFYDSASEISTLMNGLGWRWNPEARNYFYSTDLWDFFQPGSTGPFLGLLDDPNIIRRYWVESSIPQSGYCGSHCFAWFTSYELEYAAYHSTTANVWAVRDGRARVPEPATAVLLGVGLGFAWRQHRRARRR